MNFGVVIVAIFPIFVVLQVLEPGQDLFDGHFGFRFFRYSLHPRPEHVLPLLHPISVIDVVVGVRIAAVRLGPGAYAAAGVLRIDLALDRERIFRLGVRARVRVVRVVAEALRRVRRVGQAVQGVGPEVVRQFGVLVLGYFRPLGLVHFFETITIAVQTVARLGFEWLAGNWRADGRQGY